MSSRQAKVARVIPIDTPDNSSSDEGGDNSGDEEETGNEIQVFPSELFLWFCHLIILRLSLKPEGQKKKISRASGDSSSSCS